MESAEFKVLRAELKLSQGDLANKLNKALGRSYDRPKVSRWENGRESIPEDVMLEMKAMGAGKPLEAEVIAVANQKGGVGKTTTALNVAYGLKQLGARVLLIDQDPQATATKALLALNGAVQVFRDKNTMVSVVKEEKQIAEVIIKPGMMETLVALPFDLVASHIELSQMDARREPGIDVLLQEQVQTIAADYDFIIIDAPPHLGMLTWMALAAANKVIIPVRTEPYDTMGVGLILETINRVQRRLNPALRLIGILPTQHDRRKSVDREVMTDLISAMGNNAPVLRPIPANAIFGKAARNGRIALEMAASHPGPAVYGALAEALFRRSALELAAVETVPTLEEV